MALASSTRRTLIVLLSIMLTLTVLVTLTALVKAQEAPTVEGTMDPPAVPAAVKRRLAAQLPSSAHIDATYGVQLTSTMTSATGAPGTLIEFTVDVVNIGTEQDSYTLTLMNSGTWTSTLAVTSVTLDPSTPFFLNVDVEVPADAMAGDSNLLTVTATSAGDPGVSDAIDLLATAIAPSLCQGCDPVVIETEMATGSHTMALTTTHEIAVLTEASGLVAPTLIEGAIAQDPTRYDPFDDLGDHLFIMTDTVPAGALRLVVEILASEAPDADLYVGYDEDGDGLPEAAEIRCVPFLLGSFEQCSIEEPQPGVWWVLVQASYASGAGNDTLDIAWAVLDNVDIDNDALNISGPDSVPAGQPFTLDLNYDLDALNPEPGDVFYGGFSLGSQASSPTDVDNIVPVDVRYLGGPPQISIAPDSLDVLLPLGGESQHALSIANIGGDRMLKWQIAEDGGESLAPETSHEIVRDGSFELGSPNPYWDEGGDFLPPLCSPDWCGLDAARSGEWYAWFGGFGTTNTTWISQSVTIPSAQTALLSFYFSANANPSQEMGEFRVLIDGNPVAIYDENNVADFLYGYERADVDISAFADGNSHELMFVFNEIDSTGLVDDVSIEVDTSLTCIVPEAITWLSLSAQAGVTPPTASSEVEIHLDAGGLAPGTYSATLCIESDDPDTPLSQVPVTLDVRHFLYLPAVFGAGE